MTDLGPFALLETIATTGSIGRCAQHHGVSQPAVSARIRALESTLSLTLLERRPQGARLTATGALVLEWARPALAAAARLEEGLASLRGHAEEHLAVAASTTIAEYLLPGWLVTMKSVRPSVHTALTCQNSTETVAMVRRGEVELGFAEAGHVPPDLRSRLVARDRLLVFVAPSHPWARRRSVGAAEVADTGLIMREQGSGTRSVFEAYLAPRPVRAVLELSSSTAIKNAVLRGLGPAVLSSLAVAREVADGTVVSVPVRGLDLRRDLHACWRKDHRFSGPARVLLEIALAP